MALSHPGRIDVLDLVRGVALLGILLMNVQSFGEVAAVYLNPTATHPLVGVDRTLWAVVRLLADQKFLGLFAMLFGAGVLLYTDGVEARGEDVARLHRRRMGWLVVFGVLHATLVWHGDVLFCYGACGLLVVYARRLDPRRLVRAAIAVASVGSALWLLGGLTFPLWPDAWRALHAATWSPDAATQAAELAAYRGGWLDQMSMRLPQALENELGGLLFAMGWKSASLMLLGMALYRSGLFHAPSSDPRWRRLLTLGLGVGLPLTALGMATDLAEGFEVRWSFFFGSQFNYWASYAVSLGFLGGIGLARGRWPALEGRLAAVGRMAFTNYILHSLVGTWIYYGHGLGLIGQGGRVGQLAVVALLWALNLTLSPWWLARFRQGPLEWLWRSLVRGAWEPLRR